MSKALENDEQTDNGPGRTGQMDMDDRNSPTAQPDEGHVNVGEEDLGQPRLWGLRSAAGASPGACAC